MSETQQDPDGYVRPQWLTGEVDPYELLNLLHHAGQPGWSDQWGGPLGIAKAAGAAQGTLRAQAALLARLRAAAIQEALTSQSLAEVARELGISRQAVHQAARGPAMSVDAW